MTATYHDILRMLLSEEELQALAREADRTKRATINLVIAILQRECHAICAREALDRYDEPDGRAP